MDIYYHGAINEKSFIATLAKRFPETRSRKPFFSCNEYGKKLVHIEIDVEREKEILRILEECKMTPPEPEAPSELEAPSEPEASSEPEARVNTSSDDENKVAELRDKIEELRKEGASLDDMLLAVEGVPRAQKAILISQLIMDCIDESNDPFQKSLDLVLDSTGELETSIKKALDISGLNSTNIDKHSTNIDKLRKDIDGNADVITSLDASIEDIKKTISDFQEAILGLKTTTSSFAAFMAVISEGAKKHGK